jgi:hypothetical protein
MRLFHLSFSQEHVLPAPHGLILQLLWTARTSLRNAPIVVYATDELVNANAWMDTRELHAIEVSALWSCGALLESRFQVVTATNTCLMRVRPPTVRCPGSCNGHGSCSSMAFSASRKDPGTGSVYTYANRWDSNMIYGCSCDEGWEGFDCSLRKCTLYSNSYEHNVPVS